MTVQEQNSLSDEAFLKVIFDLVGREFGAGGLARFVHLVYPGSGDYTRDRPMKLGEQSAEIVEAAARTKAA